ncbi:MAG: tRNA (cytidine(34)-2'-O)-methyltransferase [Betaproteobacteria bacterium]
MFDVVLFQPEIPPNTGNVIRLCANTGCRLHLVEPLGFRMEDRDLRRAGLDYHDMTRVAVHANLAACMAATNRPERTFAFSAFGDTNAFAVRHAIGDVLMFGPESRGLPPEVLATIAPSRRLRLPMMPGNRGLNLSNSVAVAVYEAWRQAGFEGAI